MTPTWQELYDELQALKAEYKALKEGKKDDVVPKMEESFEDWLERLKTMVENPKITNQHLLS